MKRFTQSENIKLEYCCQVVRIDKIKPIEGSDYLSQTVVSGNTMVIRKDEFNTGDYALYAKNETALCEGFLSANNLYEIAEYQMNSNRDEVGKLITEGKDDDAKKMVGFFNKYGRVRMIKLRGVYSKGFLFKLDDLAKWKPEIIDEDLSQYMVNDEMGIGENFDCVCGEEFIKVYVPKKKDKPIVRKDTRNERKRQKRLERFERIDEKDFKFHYDTLQANDNIWMIDPEDVVAISTKCHGSSGIFSNIMVKWPAKLAIVQRLWNYLHRKSVELSEWLNKRTTITYYMDYGNVYASRKVIKNQFINKGVTKGFYNTDIWAEYNELLAGHINKGMTVYGEICGYVSGCATMVQKNYDYGCQEGTNFFMPYRITTAEEDGSVREWNISEVVEWTEKLISDYPELKDRIRPLDVLYHGKLSDLYPDISTTEHWHQNVLDAMKNDKVHFGMEEYEPLCNNKVPREGICIRIDNKPNIKAMKLKTDAYSIKDRNNTDKGVVDMEMAAAYGEDTEN